MGSLSGSSSPIRIARFFLSTGAGGSGLNLQAASTLINFELPWNPAKKNQRIGRIDRLGQKSNKLTIFHFITRNSIEQQIASGLLVKQNLFDGVLDGGSKTNSVDFPTKGRSQFIQQLEEFIAETENAEILEPYLNIDREEMTTTESQPEPDTIDLLQEIEKAQPFSEPSVPEKSDAVKPQEEKAHEIDQDIKNLCLAVKLSPEVNEGTVHRKFSCHARCHYRFDSKT